MDMRIRQATIEDAPFIAESLMSAVGIDEPTEELMRSVRVLCQRDDTLYSWRNTLIAEVDGKCAGSITSYKGCDYERMRSVTFDYVLQTTGQDFHGMDMETLTGEYYLDSLAVRQPFRRQGIGTALLHAGMAEAERLGIETVTLACDPDNIKAYELYCALGFVHTDDLFIFGGNYWKMERTNTL